MLFTQLALHCCDLRGSPLNRRASLTNISTLKEQHAINVRWRWCRKHESALSDLAKGKSSVE
ncbi:hypothetical protein E2C01_001304 [Portunus trituberculatus]|uniref:Uncharacterized protein n=1 Tax=Portunus trituberculatus TaxID=210409 RepID=A0A5B7CH99_PORTR|nr:hypothetical protein [Portunus trituberculatus]